MYKNERSFLMEENVVFIWKSGSQKKKKRKSGSQLGALLLTTEHLAIFGDVTYEGGKSILGN